MDLVTVAQALHWFDVEAFYAEARRVARPGALIAVWTYPRPRFADAQLDRRSSWSFTKMSSGRTGRPSGATSRPNYTHAAVSVRRTGRPGIRAGAGVESRPGDGYVSSWSATARYRKALGADPVPLLQASLGAVWNKTRTVKVRMP